MNTLKHLAINDEGFIFNPTTGESWTTNKTGLFILKLLKEGLAEEEILNKLVEEFETDKDTAYRDLTDFLEKLRSYKLI